MNSFARISIVKFAVLPCALAVLVAFGITSSLHVNAASERVADLRGLNESFVEISEDASKAVVFVQAEAKVERQALRGKPQQTPQSESEIRPIGQGTGFIISEDGYIVTNHHVVGNADRVRVKLTNGTEYLAEVVGSDEATEIALIKIDENNLPTVPLGDSDELQVGEWALAIGNPFGLSHSVTAGIISAKGRGEVGITDYADFIQTDAAINPGNSGGPLLNIDGEVIGLNTAMYSRSGGSMGIGFAVPINMVRHVTDQLRTDGKITRGFLGISIQNVTPELADWFEIDGGNGILVAEVQEDSPAQEGGLLRDDIIVELDGRAIDEIGSFRSRIATTEPGEKVDLKIVRDGKELDKRLAVGSLNPENASLLGTTPGGRLGLELEELTPDIADQLGYNFEEGIVIKAVENDSAAQRAGVRPGMIVLEVNRRAVKSVEQLRDVLSGADAGEPVLLLVQHRGVMRYLILRP
jgi:serine protease Do